MPWTFARSLKTMNGLFRCPGALTDHKNGDPGAADGPVLGSEEAPTQTPRPIMIKFFIFGTEKYRFAVDIPNKATDQFF